MSKNVSEVLNSSMEKVRQMVDANTVVGRPIAVGGDVTVIPISKISLALASGGADMAAKETAGGSFGGGAGCGVKILPVAMLVIQADRVRMLPIGEPANSAAERLIEELPGLVDKITDLIRDRKNDASEI